MSKYLIVWVGKQCVQFQIGDTLNTLETGVFDEEALDEIRHQIFSINKLDNLPTILNWKKLEG